MRSWGIWAGALGAILLSVGAADAQTTYDSRPSTPLAIRSITPPQGERIARPGEPMLVQPMSSIRAAKLDDDAPTGLGIMYGPDHGKLIPAGTHLFGVEFPDGWAFCAVVPGKSWFGLNGQETTCFQDTDHDGRFDQVRPSGPPFQGMPLLIFEPGPPSPLPNPIRYSPLPYVEGPTVDYSVMWKPVGSKAGRDGAPAPLTEAVFNIRVTAGKSNIDLSGQQTLWFKDAQPQQLIMDGCLITVLGVTADGGLRYRVDLPMPTQVSRITMQVVTSTYYYVYVVH